MSVSEVIRENIRRLRKENGWSQRELADQTQTRWGPPAEGERWTQFRISDIEGGRAGRQRTIAPEELVALSRAFRVPLQELFKVEGDETVQLGRSEVTSADFFQLVFSLPEEYRDRITELLYGGFRGGDTRSGTHHEWQFAWVRDTTRELLRSGQLNEELMLAVAGGDQSAVSTLLDLYRDAMGPEIFDAVMADPRFWRQHDALGADKFTGLVLETVNDMKEREE